MTERHYLYTLVFDAAPDPVVFYVGHTNNPKRRETEHKSSAKDAANTEYKYQWCRQLEAVGVDWQFVVVGEILDDEDSEYEWVLKFARDNQSKGISFIAGLPLTNMKAGDFLGEILHRTDINTAAEIRQYRTVERVKNISYQREPEQSADYQGTERSRQFEQYMAELGAASSAETAELRQAAEARAKKLITMLNSTAREQQIAAATVKLILDYEPETDPVEVKQQLKLLGGYLQTITTMRNPKVKFSDAEHQKIVDHVTERIKILTALTM